MSSKESNSLSFVNTEVTLRSNKGLLLFPRPGFQFYKWLEEKQCIYHSTRGLSTQTDRRTDKNGNLQPGRLLAELSAPQSAIEAAESRGVNMQLVPNTHPGSRRGEPTLRSAYQAMFVGEGNPEQEVINGIAWIFREMMPLIRPNTGDTEEGLNGKELEKLLLIPEALLAFAFNRAYTPFGEIESLLPVLPDINKAAEGFHYVVGLELVDFPINYRVKDTDLFQFAEKRKDSRTGRTYLQGSKISCPAGEDKITLMGRAFLGQEGNPGASMLNDLFPDAGQVRKFAKQYFEYSEYADAFEGAIKGLANTCKKAIQIGVLTPNMNAGTSYAKEYYDILQRCLRLFEKWQNPINKSLGRKDYPYGINSDQYIRYTGLNWEHFMQQYVLNTKAS